MDYWKFCASGLMIYLFSVPIKFGIAIFYHFIFSLQMITEGRSSLTMRNA